MEERIDKNELLDNGHWTDEWYAQRITAKQWRALLLQNDDKIICEGNIRKLKANHLGLGVYEITKEPLKEGGE